MKKVLYLFLIASTVVSLQAVRTVTSPFPTTHPTTHPNDQATQLVNKALEIQKRAIHASLAGDAQGVKQASVEAKEVFNTAKKLAGTESKGSQIPGTTASFSMNKFNKAMHIIGTIFHTINILGW